MVVVVWGLVWVMLVLLVGDAGAACGDAGGGGVGVGGGGGKGGA